MKNFIKYVFVYLIALVGCTKATDKFTPYTNTEMNDLTWSNSSMSAQKIANIKSQLVALPIANNFNSSTGSSISINSNTQLNLAADIYTLNDIAYTGAVNSAFTLLTKKGDFIRNLISTCNGKTLYDTKGIYLLQLSNTANNSLTLKPNSFYDFALTDATGVAGNYVYLKGNNIAQQQGAISWSAADTTIGVVSSGQATINGAAQQAFLIKSSSQSWINVAKPIYASGTTNANIILSAQNFTNKNTLVFAVLANYNTVLLLQDDASSKTYLAQNLPVGEEVKFVSLSYIDNQFYLGSKSFIIGNNISYSFAPASSPVSLAYLNSFLDGL